MVELGNGTLRLYNTAHFHEQNLLHAFFIKINEDLLVICICSYLQNKTAEVIDSLEMASVKVLNIIGDLQKVTTKSRATDV